MRPELGQRLNAALVVELAGLARDRPAHDLSRHTQTPRYPSDALALNKYARRILPIVSTVIIPAGPLCNQRRHLPLPESVNFWAPSPADPQAQPVNHSTPIHRPGATPEPPSSATVSPSMTRVTVRLGPRLGAGTCRRIGRHIYLPAIAAAAWRLKQAAASAAGNLASRCVHPCSSTHIVRARLHWAYRRGFPRLFRYRCVGCAQLLALEHPYDAHEPVESPQSSPPGSRQNHREKCRRTT